MVTPGEGESRSPVPGPADGVPAELELVAVEAARRAGAYVSRRFGGGLEIERKDDSTRSLVTDADRESQRLVAEIVAARYPDHLLLGEEDPPENAPAAPDFVWAVDPIDGTTNFVNGLPTWAVSVGVLHRGRPFACACWVPWPGEQGHALFHARRGGGAWQDGRRLAVRGPAEGERPEKGRISFVPGGLSGSFKIGHPLRHSLGEHRTTGSAVCELALVAAGASQYTVTGAARVWDFAAGTLLVAEAGGRVLTVAGGGPPSWRPLVTFDEHYENSPDTFRRLRAWRGPVIAGAPGVVDFLAANLTPRGRPLLQSLRRALFGVQRS